MVSSIAFIPSVLILASLLLGVLVFYFEDYKYTRWLSKNLEFVLVSGSDNARMVLTTIVGGMISLTVFSFSMVMVVLNRTSDSLSPRLLPQLVAKKFHQVVLGVYMGTIVYSLILVISIGPDKTLPALGILLSMILAISSLALFIYFIHSISESIQVNNIMRDILNRTLKQIEELDKIKTFKAEFKNIEPSNGRQILALETGYQFHSPPEILLNFLQNKNIKLQIEAFQGQFLIEGSLLAAYYPVSRDVKAIKDLHSYFYGNSYPDEREQFFDNFRQISEIALKALSPGINDPGTALIAIRFLTILFEKVVHFPEHLGYEDENDELFLMDKLPSLEHQLQECIAPIRQCAGGSTEIILGLLTFFEALLKKSPRQHHQTLFSHIGALVESADSSLYNQYDRSLMNKVIKKLRSISNYTENEIPLLKL